MAGGKKTAADAAAWCRRSGARDLGLARLAASGLDAGDAVTLGLDALDAAATRGLHGTFDPRPSLRIPYWRPDRPGEALRPFPGWPAFYRLRYLGEPPPSFEDQAEARPRRYAQEPDTGVCAYFARGLADWPSIVDDPSVPLLVTEGEFKGAKACKEGYPTVGLGGVYNWRSARLGVPFLPELAAVQWARREVYLCFDSDFSRNELVCAALMRVAEELCARGALPMVACLPDLADGSKTGLDDFLVARPADDLDRLLGQAQPLTLARALWQISSEVVYVRDPGMVVVRKGGQRMNPGAFTGHAYSNRPYFEQELGPDGQMVLKPKPAAAAWLRWPLRSEVARMTYSPGQAQVCGADDELEWNMWPGWAAEPKKGTVRPFLDLVAHLFKGAEKGAEEWFLRWLACPLQRPGIKMFSAAVLHGRRTGTGKSLVGYTVGAIYGRNFVEIKQADIDGDFNEWAENKQFVLGDEVTGSNRRKDADTLKKMITQRTMRVNAKFIPSYEVPDRINYLFTSNHPDAFFMEDDDRRLFVHEVGVGPLPDAFYRDYRAWLDDGGPAHLFRWMLDLDLGDFNPAAQAMRTLARDRMVADGRSDLDAWCAALRMDPDSTLRFGDVALPADLFTAGELLDLYDPMRRTGATSMGVARALRRAGVPLALDGGYARASGGKLDRLYVLRDLAKWIKADRKRVEAHLRQAAEPPRRKGPAY